MKTILKFLLAPAVLALLTQCKKESEISIPDNIFLQILIEKGIDKDGNNKISEEEASAVKTLILNERSISELTGIESFVNLDTLECNYNLLTTLDVSSNKNLTYLKCDGNNLNTT